MDRVKELEKSLATKTKESVEVGGNNKQLEEENKRLMDRVKGLEESLATKPEENVKVGEDKGLLQEDRRQLKEERGSSENRAVKNSGRRLDGAVKIDNACRTKTPFSSRRDLESD